MICSEDIPSSPDPLGASQSKQEGAIQKTTPKKPLADTSSNVQRRDFYLTTPPHYANGNCKPFKLVAEAENPISPWRIRVTVQAEHGDTGRVAGRTTTTTVPLKGACDYSPSISRKGRGTPRKPSNSSVKRAGTPKPKAPVRRKATPTSAKRLAKEDCHQNPSPPKRRRGRPRKSAECQAEEPEARDELGPVVHAPAQNDTAAPKSTQGLRLRSRGRRKALSPTAPDSCSPAHDSSRFNGAEKNPAEPVDQLDRIHLQSHVPDPTSEHEEFDSILESEGFSMVSVSSLPSAKLCLSNSPDRYMNGDDSASSPNDDSSERAPKSNPLPVSPPLSAQSDLENSEGTGDLQPQKWFSPKSSFEEKKPTLTPVVDRTPLKISPPKLFPPMVKAPTIRNSPRPLEKASDGTPRLIRVVRAGAALQGVLSPSQEVEDGIAENGHPSLFSKSPRKRLGNLFDGFGADTRREMRAGLRLGEELAKQYMPQAAVTAHRSEDDVFAQEETASSSKLPNRSGESSYTLRLPERSQTTMYPVLNTQLPSPQRSQDSDEDRMSRKTDTPKGPQVLVGKTNDERQISENLKEMYASMGAEAAEEYRLERDAVIRQIEEANASQVIVINSDSEGEQEDSYAEDQDNDIWQEQAYISEQQSEPEPDDMPPIFQDQDFRPRRSQLPSPWRRQSQASSPSQYFAAKANAAQTIWHRDCQIALSSRVTASEADLFWQPSLTANTTFKREDFSDDALYPDLMSRSSPDLIHDQNHDYRSSSEIKDEETRESSSQGTQDDEKFSRECTERMDPRISEPPQEAFANPKINKTSSTNKQTSNAKPQPTTSWLGYLTSFVPLPGWGDTATLAPKNPHRRPNGKPKLPLAGSLEGPISFSTPWTEAHYRALYFHYAASLEGRRKYNFNPKSGSARYVGRMISTRGWERAVTKTDCAIVDAFMVDLKARGVEHAVIRERELVVGDAGIRIDEWYALEMVFTLWMGGVKRGECEVGSGKTGLAENEEVMWRAELESWGRRLAKRSVNGVM